MNTLSISAPDNSRASGSTSALDEESLSNRHRAMEGPSKSLEMTWAECPSTARACKSSKQNASVGEPRIRCIKRPMEFVPRMGCYPKDNHKGLLGSRLIKSTIQEQRRGRQRPGNFAPASRSKAAKAGRRLPLLLLAFFRGVWQSSGSNRQVQPSFLGYYSQLLSRSGECPRSDAEHSRVVFAFLRAHRSLGFRYETRSPGTSGAFFHSLCIG